MPFLTPRTTVDYLLEHRLLTPACVLDADLAVEEVSQRNSNYKVTRTSGPCYLLKQGLDRERAAALDREALVYARIRGAPDGRTLRPHTVRLFRHDPVENVLVLEFVRRAEDLRGYHARRGFSTAHARGMARVLAAVHQLPPDFLASLPARSGAAVETTEDARLDPPWVLSAHRPGVEVLRHVSAGALDLIGIVQQTERFAGHLDELRGEWAPSCVIHGDVRWGNWLLCRGARRERLKLVDWELAGIGDPCWDVGSILSDYLSWWLLNLPQLAMDAMRTLPAPALSALRGMQRATGAFWREYCRVAALDGDPRRRFLRRAMRYGGARLMQTAYEQLQSSWRMNAVALQLLQLSLNVLNRPDDALRHLCGTAPYDMAES
jgi:aminoglycoside phosphotransferase (APT) family kinase protein